MSAPIVFFDIAGPDSKQLSGFYRDVFSWDVSSDGKIQLDVRSPIDAQIRQDPAEKRMYIGVTDVASSLDEIAMHGGSIDVPRFEVPGVVVLGLFRDPAGNPMGLVEMNGDDVVIP